MKYVGHFYQEDMPPLHSPDQGRHLSWARRVLIDHSLGAEHLEVLVVDLGAGGKVELHDNPFEHTYYLLEGEVVMTLEGQEYRVGPGGYAWTSVGASHALRNEGQAKARWLEFIAPRPPSQGAFRWLNDWAKREAAAAYRGTSPLEAAAQAVRLGLVGETRRD